MALNFHRIVLLIIPWMQFILCTADYKDTIEGEFIVRFRGDTDEVNVVQTLKNYAVQRRILSPKGTIALLNAQPDDVSSLYTDPIVDIVEPNRIVKLEHITKEQVNIDSQSDTGDECIEQRGSDTWHLTRISHRERPEYSTDPFTIEHQGDGVDIYIVDTGINKDHPDFGGRAIWGFTESGLFTREGHNDQNGHGTHVASLAAGVTWGVSKKANVIAVKVLSRFGIGTMFSILEGLGWTTEDHVRKKNQGRNPRGVINMSLGGSAFSQVYQDAVDDAFNAGLVIIGAAGNEANDTLGSFPAAFENVIAVGATAHDDTMAYFSNWGCAVAISAPGVDITGAWSSETPHCRNNYANDPNCLNTISGTSMASPIVAGVAASYISASSMNETTFKTLVPNRMLEILTATATKDVIRFQSPSQRSTTNRLVYRSCVQLDWEPNNGFLPCVGPSDTPAPNKSSLIQTSTSIYICIISFFTLKS